MAYVYRHIRLDKNVPFYIGIGTDDKGKYSRALHKKSRNIYWKRIVSKTEYLTEIIIDDISIEEANKKEVEFIKLYGRSNLGKGALCNLTDGGDGIVGYKMSEETRLKMSKTRKGRKPSAESISKVAAALRGRKRPEEVGRKISEIKKGKYLGVNNPFFGKTHSDEFKIKRSLAQKGEKSPLFGKRGYLSHNYGKKRSSEDLKKMSIRVQGEKNPFYSKSHSEEFKNRRRVESKLNKSVIQFSLDGEEIKEYISIREAARLNNFDRTGVAHACNGNLRTYRKFIWKFKN